MYGIPGPQAALDCAVFTASTNGTPVSSEAPETQGLLRRACSHESTRLRELLGGRERVLHYEPIARLTDGRVDHYEALLRLRAPNGQRHRPGAFIDVAERAGLIGELDLWVVDRAFDTLRDTHGSTGYRLSINVSAGALTDDRFPEYLANRLEWAPALADRLVLEITETDHVRDVRAAGQRARHLRALGCRLALDDFGSGFSNLRYLKHLPVDYLKIDGDFIAGIHRDPQDRDLVRHMVGMARHFGQATVAEHVAGPAAWEAVRALGVDYAQGHHVGRDRPTLPGLTR